MRVLISKLNCFQTAPILERLGGLKSGIWLKNTIVIKEWGGKFWYPHGMLQWLDICKLLPSHLLENVENLIDEKVVGLQRKSWLDVLQSLFGPINVLV